MGHLFTITGNLLAETTACYEAVGWNKTNRAAKETFQVGGKGINVARMAQRLGMFSTAVCFPGGHSGARCLSWLRAQHFAVAPFLQAGETRGGWVVRSGRSETTFLGCDRPLEEEPWQQAITYLEHAVRPGDMLAICGSLPGWRPELAAVLRKLLKSLGEDVFVALDTYGAPLHDLLECPIDLLKINRHEFLPLVAEVAGMGDLSTADLVRVAAQHPEVKRWVITAGSGPVMALDQGGREIWVEPPSVDVVSAVGCGDVLLAGLLDALIRTDHLEEALRQALPLAAANAAVPGIAEFPLEKVPRRPS